ncbi:hypothetical protein HHK36_011530 [Tetracentron sinense]|uniref:PGG domain-containing protein n=1 Tax=Tetracentron sinense TaxID=13715 RepID=A0A835DHD4_TETSI|nr:hypothetical protein HHK36_011530 [Tetracentron sinense]
MAFDPHLQECRGSSPDIEPSYPLDLYSLEHPPSPPPRMEYQEHFVESMGGQTITPQTIESQQEGNRVDYYYHLPLYEAAEKGDWRSATTFFERHPDVEITAVINIDLETALHVAARRGHLQFVKKLLDRMPPAALALKDINGDTTLHIAARSGRSDIGKSIMDKNHDLTLVVNKNSRTALHVASARGHFKFVKELLKRMLPAELAFQDINGDTALHLAAISGSTDIAKSILRKNLALAQIRSKDGWTPLLYAATVARLEQKELVWHLCLVTRDDDPSPFADAFGAELICNITASGFYDISLHLVKRYPHLATAVNAENDTVLSLMAQRPSAFPSGSRLGFWKQCIYACIPVETDASHHAVRGDIENPPEGSGNLAGRFQRRTYLTEAEFQWLKRLLWNVIELVPGVKKVRETKLSHKHAIELVEHVCTQIQNSDFFRNSNIFTTAIEFGIVELVTKCGNSFIRLNVLESEFLKEGTRFHIAIQNRREKIFNLIYRWAFGNTLFGIVKDNSENTILHVAAKLAPSSQLNSVSGAALQMQRELQWFKEVEKLVQPSYRESKNKDGKTARVIFTEEHKDLVEKGQKWMKATSSSCMVVATLIATVMFAAAFTVPGGNQNDRGIPIFLNANSFLIFAISDALSLFSSLTSVLMFLSILTSRYAEEDFLYSLPKKLIIGLASLFISIATMMIAFSATLSIVLSKRLSWVFIPISLLACIPVTLFASLQFPLLVEIVRSTYGPRIFDRK